jgi:hypothetical protein
MLCVVSVVLLVGACSGVPQTAGRYQSSATTGSEVWTIDLVDRQSGEHGSGYALAIDPWDRVHISYNDSHDQSIIHLSNAHGRWEQEVVERIERRNWVPFLKDMIGVETSIAVDRQGNMHIAYFDKASMHLKHAGLAGGEWRSEIVHGTGVSGLFCAMGVDSSGTAHIIHMEVDESLKHSVKDCADAIISAERAVPRQGTPVEASETRRNVLKQRLGLCIVSSLFDHTELRGLRYTTGRTGSWRTAEYTSDLVPFYDTSVAVDGNNHLHMTYYSKRNGDLQYSTNRGGSWSDATVDGAQSDVGKQSELAIDPRGYAHVCYWDETNHTLKYATNVSGAFASVVIEQQDKALPGCDIAVDLLGRIHISYVAETPAGNAVKYSTNKFGNSTNFVICNDKEGIRAHTAIAVDSRGLIHVVFTSGLAGHVWYATNVIR